jgi:hypothetical protein
VGSIPAFLGQMSTIAQTLINNTTDMKKNNLKLNIKPLKTPRLNFKVRNTNILVLQKLKKRKNLKFATRFKFKTKNPILLRYLNFFLKKQTNFKSTMLKRTSPLVRANSDHQEFFTLMFKKLNRESYTNKAKLRVLSTNRISLTVFRNLFLVYHSQNSPFNTLYRHTSSIKHRFSNFHIFSHFFTLFGSRFYKKLFNLYSNNCFFLNKILIFYFNNLLLVNS